MRQIESEISAACLQSSGQVRESLQKSKGPLQLGLRGEILSSVLEGRVRHISGARAFAASERAYNGGPSAVDAVDKMDL